ncbi:hypothetical protein FKM82_021385 [Ascaphus truei]
MSLGRPHDVPRAAAALCLCGGWEASLGGFPGGFADVTPRKHAAVTYPLTTHPPTTHYLPPTHTLTYSTSLLTLPTTHTHPPPTHTLTHPTHTPD